MSDLTQQVRRLGHSTEDCYPALLAESRTPLWTAESLVENTLQFGKVQNLRKAVLRLHLVEIPAGEIFSFWKQLGKAKTSAGYVRGRELRQGCMIPSVGGGLCQISNSLYDLALKSGCEIVERHAHTSVVPGSAAERGRDATVFWNYVDLRFRAKQDTLVTAELTRDELILRFRGKQRLIAIGSDAPSRRQPSSINTCTDCTVSGCFRHVAPQEPGSAARAAFLIEECWPEFEDFAWQARSDADDLFLPYHSRFLRAGRYNWNNEGYRRTIAANTLTLLAAARSRLHRNGSVPVVSVQVDRSRALADYYGRRIPIDARHLYVSQSLLPFLWRRGDLGGRSFTVLMSRLPLHVLHRKLDGLSAQYADRKTFREFRAPQWMEKAEAEALEQADRIVTPHALLARVFPHKTTCLGWKMPQSSSVRRGSRIVFPGPALARKGAFEVREVMRHLGSPLLSLHGSRETERFWDGIQLENGTADWLDQASVVVQPAFLENNPRPLLRALAAGIPAIATAECGIESHPLLTLVPAGDVEALGRALQKVLAR